MSVRFDPSKPYGFHKDAARPDVHYVQNGLFFLANGELKEDALAKPDPVPLAAIIAEPKVEIPPAPPAVEPPVEVESPVVDDSPRRLRLRTR